MALKPVLFKCSRHDRGDALVSVQAAQDITALAKLCFGLLTELSKFGPGTITGDAEVDVSATTSLRRPAHADLNYGGSTIGSFAEVDVSGQLCPLMAVSTPRSTTRPVLSTAMPA